MMPPEGRGFESHRLRQNCGFDRTKSRRGNSAAQVLIQEVNAMNKTIAILMGLQGSGKSTFYKTYLSDNFVRVNLDTLKTRQVIEFFLLSGIRRNSILTELNHFFYIFFSLTSIVILHKNEKITNTH